jgi:gluconolactonase
MTARRFALLPLALTFFALPSSAAAQRAAANPLRDAPPVALVDLRVDAAAALVAATWETRPLELTPVEFPSPGRDLRPSGPPRRTLDVAPKPGQPAFAGESGWERIAASSLEARRSTGRFAGQWFRLSLVLPEELGGVAVAGKVVALEMVVDDYTEVLVDGAALPLVPGQREGGVVAGWNALQTVILSDRARPGARYEIAILALNGPLSQPPENYVWFRSAVLAVYEPSRFPREVECAFQATGDGLLEVVAKDARLLRIADGFLFAEGPCVLKDGSVVFSDPNRNAIFRHHHRDGISVYRPNSGYTGVDVGRYRQPGSNGLALDPQGRLVICEHGNRRLTRLEPNGVLTVLADRFEGARLNSPNDVVVRRDGTIYFTDPPFGLPDLHDDPARETQHSGVYSLRNGSLTLIDGSLRGPNGVALSEDQRTLYVANWDEQAKTIHRYALDAAGNAGKAERFADLTNEEGEEALDGIELDPAGRVFVSGPGGVHVFASDGSKLGKLTFPELPANFAFLDADGAVMILAARTGLYRFELRPRPETAPEH